MTVGSFFRTLRNAQGLTQEEFAVKYGVTRNFMMRVETGKRQPTAAMLLAIVTDCIPQIESQLPARRLWPKLVTSDSSLPTGKKDVA